MKALITGANRGLGLALTRVFLENGHSVYAGARSVSNAGELAGVREQYPNQLHICELDVTNEDSVQRCAHQVEQSTSMLDVIVNNAGVLLGRDDGIQEVDLQHFQTTFDINTFGPVRVLKYFAQLLLNSENPVVLNISSEAGSMTTSWHRDYSYSMSKTALNMFSHILRNDLRRESHGRARVYAVHPGWMRTDMGGPDAPLDPTDAAQSIFGLVTGSTIVDNDTCFVNQDGTMLSL